MKRKIALILAAIIAVGAFSGCANGNVDEFNFPEIIVMQGSAGNRLLKSNETPLFVVTKRIQELDENDDIVDVLCGYENGEERKYAQ